MPNLVAIDDAVAATLDRLADQDLVGVGAVDVGGVEERDAEVEGAVDRRDPFGLVGRAVELGHAHAAEAEGGHGEGAEIAGLHGVCQGIQVNGPARDSRGVERGQRVVQERLAVGRAG